MPRNLTSSDVLDHNVGALSGMAYGTAAVIFKTSTTTGSRAWFGLHTSGGVGRLEFNIDGQTIGYWNGSNYRQTGNLISSTTTWYLLVIRKATGNVIARASLYDFSADTWTHAAIGAAIGDATSPGASGFVEFRYDGAEQWEGDVAVRAAWSNSNPWTADTTGDAAIEAAGLQLSLREWYGASPTSLWVYDQQATGQNVPDLAGGGATQSSITGTSVTSGSLPTFGYGNPLFEVLSAPAGGGQSAAMGTVIETDAAQTFAKTKRAAVGVSSETDAAQTLGRQKKLAAEIAAQTDAAQPVGRRKVRALGTALEIDTAIVFSAAGPITAPANPALETDFSMAVGRRKQQTPTPAPETDVAVTIGHIKRRALGTALETDAAIILGEAEPVFPALETDTAQAVGKRKVRALGTAVEVDTALGITRFVLTKIVKFPTYKERVGNNRLFRRYTRAEPVSLIKKAGIWIEIVSPHQDEIAAAEKFYQGGLRHVLSDAEAADLPPQYVEEET